ncbi:hypothetical protein ACLM5J_14945 [Nocardioides sp. Bht2]|uniref:hypothetical protein n=1 Tax=Nocardioides sp. Bht2 TaxID=3392297 RepID=UPI0039B5ED9F
MGDVDTLGQRRVKALGSIARLRSPSTLEVSTSSTTGIPLIEPPFIEPPLIEPPLIELVEINPATMPGGLDKLD